MKLPPSGKCTCSHLANVHANTNEQQLSSSCKRFLYADDLCIITQQRKFPDIEKTLKSELHTLSAYYRKSDIKPNPAKTQVSTFHLNSHEAKTPLNITWEGQHLEHNPFPKYLRVSLDWALCFKQQCYSTKAKVAARTSSSGDSPAQNGEQSHPPCELQHWPYVCQQQNMHAPPGPDYATPNMGTLL